MARDDREDAQDPNNNTSANRQEITLILFFMAFQFVGKYNIFLAKGYDFRKNCVSLPL